jgi:hypothetical protein
LVGGEFRIPTAEAFAEMRREYERVVPHPEHFDQVTTRVELLVPLLAALSG